ncbi:hypothetical protein DES36_12329 [Alkalibaculum bacchi]|uniref:Uncharacterized protein n=1 Tax=Alkalibaculum bacchi TaxID=645887 RepID=A0A366I0B7_9FIRM|nr:hypothetical protein [Alkalibaculum bacchi]RBP58460.1 hypothetical protein DES36_12329 [Alkalibaculum bacchi]
MKNKRKKQDVNICDIDDEDSDEFFYYIAGYTSNGFAYGITWEQAIEDGLIDQKELDDDTEELPF